jgi:HEAT repeat protein
MGEPAVDPLVDVVTGPDPEAAAEAGSVLERIVGSAPFVKAAASTDPDERLRSIEVLGAMGGPAAVQVLLSGLSDPEARVRARAAALLGGMGEARAARELRRMVLGDPVPEVAAAAEAALRLLETLPARPAGPVEPQDDQVAEDFPRP